jgi:rod shape-determining protein MreD
MTLYVGAGLAFVLGVLQSAVVSQLRLFGVSPDVVVLLTISCVLLWGLRDGLLVALVGGVVLDMTSSAPFGLSILSLLVVALLSGLGEINVFRAARLLPLITTLVGVMAYYAVFLLFLRLAAHPVMGWALAWRVVLPKVVVNLLFMPLVYGAMRWINGRSDAPATGLP